MAVDAGTGHRPLSWFNSRPGLQFPQNARGRALRKRIIQLRGRMLTSRSPRRSERFKSMNAPAQSVPCPKCHARMIHAAVTPHPMVATMQRITFVCYGCNQTRTYMLPVAMPPVVAATEIAAK